MAKAFTMQGAGAGTGTGIAAAAFRWSLVIMAVLVMTCSAVLAGTVPPPGRIVSLAPALTEVLFTLGAGDRVIGVTSFCDQPAEAKKKQKVGGMSNPSLEAIVALKPDLVVMSTDGNPKEVEVRLRSMGLSTYVWTARKLSDLPGGIRSFSAALGVGARGEELAKDIEQSMERAAAKGRSTVKRKVLYIVWPEPLLVAGPGTAIDDAIRLLGHRNAASRAKTSYPRYSIEELIREAPEVIFIGKGSGMDMQVVSQGILKKLSTVPAVGNGRVCYVSDSLYRLGPRVVRGIEELDACAH